MLLIGFTQDGNLSLLCKSPVFDASIYWDLTHLPNTTSSPPPHVDFVALYTTFVLCSHRYPTPAGTAPVFIHLFIH